ncbi:hypothetical protein [Flammeovirga sp. SubArs3]|uniref:hypothetical protein n=1 Tax=Flammeovirga sp. SubArs3 TaxID=2995316 RepID=UPI00248D2DDD|nr:hypothetical protein [Flammeovirga sp. SubArs3]
MRKSFRLYSSMNSSYFDLISGNKETQQTKGLGLLLSKSQTALEAFLDINSIKSKIGEINLKSISRVIVNCELISNSHNKYRADIVLRFYKNGKPFKAILIEAKSINKGTSVYETNKQIENYIENEVFEELKVFGKESYGVTLTKLPSYTKHASLISITWEDIIGAFYRVIPNQNTLLDDYFNFLTNINGTMKFYEKEVFSIPTAKWSEQAINKLKVYECPNSGKYLIKHKPLYITFRKSGGGEMDKLFKVEDIIILNFHDDFETFLKDENYSENYRNRVNGYVDYLLEKKIWIELPKDEKQVFILSDNIIELKNKPKPKNGNNSFRAYYELADLLNKKLV